ncbi:MAG: hypothetical protein JWR21_1667 [Herminiimonas sp.]|nr:hypothetical protein [Herminiimonas sp.]MDB5854599.1 hypothetical protein [Herminiimonas sp.]
MSMHHTLGRSCLADGMRRALAGLVLGAAFLLCMSAQRCHAAGVDTDSATVERSIKAAYLYKFLSYVEWPPSSLAPAPAPYVIAVVGDDEVLSELTALTRGRTSSNRQVTVKRLNFGDPVTGVHLLFVGQQETARQGQWLRQAALRPVLTVTDSDAGLSQGGVINFRQIDGHIRFEVSLAAAERNELKLSSRMLAVALNVRQAN